MTNFWFDQERNFLVYPNHPGAPLHLLPEAKVNGKYFAVPRTLINSQILRHYNYPVVPIMDNYDWPSAPNIKPWESQKLVANFMVLHPRCFVLSDLGTGKTLAALWAMDWLMRQGIIKRALIVCPLSIMERVWTDAIFKNFLNKRSVEILHGDADRRCELLAKKADIFVVNHDGVGIGAHTRGRFELAGFSQQLAERDDIQLVIVDEATAYKDSSTKRHRIARLAISQRSYVQMLTGTPTPTAPTDSYGLAKLINNAFGKSFHTFRNETMRKVSQFRWLPLKDGYDKARQLLSPSIRIPIEEVYDAPPMTVQQREVQLTTEQKKLMADLKAKLQIIIKSGVPITAANEAAVRTKFLQISLGAVYDAGHGIHHVDAKPRLDELKAVIEQITGKCLIFAGLTSVLTLLNSVLKKEYACEVVNGDVSAKERSRIFQDFQSKESPRLLLADARCMAHGLTLTAARSVVWYGPVDSAEIFSQANARIHRPGQKFPTTIVQIVSNTLEREIFRRLEHNMHLQGALLDAVAAGKL